MIFYSAEARGYSLMVALVLLSTLAMVRAVETRRARWWVAYAACACAAVYTHYTSVFALAGQLLWLLWAHPEARRPAIAASAGAAVAFVPWLSGFTGDLNSTTTDILSALQPFDVRWVRTSLTHWAVGYPYAGRGTGLRDLPGGPALILLAVGLVVALTGVVAPACASLAAWLGSTSRSLLVVVLAVSVPAGEAIASALGSNVFGTRNLAASWPAFALCLAAFLVAAGPRAGRRRSRTGDRRLCHRRREDARQRLPARRLRRGECLHRPQREAAGRRRRRGEPQPGGPPHGAQGRLRAGRTARSISTGTRSPTTRSGSWRSPRPSRRLSTARPPRRPEDASSSSLSTTPRSSREAIAALPRGYRRLETRTYPGIDTAGPGRLRRPSRTATR